MQGYPQLIATVQDFQNLINDPKFREQALIDLQVLQDFDDRTATIATKPINKNDPESDWKTKKIENPTPLHRQKGFKRWMRVVKFIAKETKTQNQTVADRVQEILASYSSDEIADAPVVLT